MSNKHQIPTYIQAIQALKNGDDDTVASAVFAFKVDDGYHIERVTEALQSLLKRTDLTPDQIRSIERSLYGLGRLPLRTPGLDVCISLITKGDSGAMSYDLFLSSDRFATESSGYIDSGCGSDAISGLTFEVKACFRNYTGFLIEVDNWPDIFSEMSAAELHIDDQSDDSLIDWEHPDGSLFWEWIAKHD